MPAPSCRKARLPAILLGATMLLGGCYAAPYPGYADGYTGYAGEGVYAPPVVVAPPVLGEVVIGGGYRGGYRGYEGYRNGGYPYGGYSYGGYRDGGWRNDGYRHEGYRGEGGYRGGYGR